MFKFQTIEVTFWFENNHEKIIFTSLTSADDLCKATNFPDSKILCAKKIFHLKKFKKNLMLLFLKKNKGIRRTREKNFHSNDIAAGHNSLWNCCNYKFLLYAALWKENNNFHFFFALFATLTVCSIEETIKMIFIAVGWKDLQSFWKSSKRRINEWMNEWMRKKMKRKEIVRVEVRDGKLRSYVLILNV